MASFSTMTGRTDSMKDQLPILFRLLEVLHLNKKKDLMMIIQMGR